ncbi:DUF3106 domain-containing protein [Verminephrobacter eiseniae]|nr:DUF3106 domain-containing protein [Verminephrobacter eiseniae]MCW5283120.1 DUF3106 domain-containing protein [Verminephrobacter eiseniae]MCW5303436.1 DUF3106 domain-containing protein [Verminephrobacter eiseniae]MCW8192846.1 DUF3106 domain-containing protein [Verminephrobacter eiseniae]
MHPRPPGANPALPVSLLQPAFVLALALLGLLTALGAQVGEQMHMAPGTPLPAGAEAAVAGPNKARTPPAGGAVPPAQAQPGPGWETLDTAQKLALYPLAERWSLISQAQKRRWLTLAANYPHLSQEEQRKFLERITAWANLSAQQRSQARLNYAVTTGLARADKRAQWEAYQALSDEQRRALAARADPKPRGAATALRPVSPKKLAQVPAALQAHPGRPNAPKIPPVIDHSPRVAAPVTPMALPAAGHAAQYPLLPGAASTGVETTPVAVPVAVPTALPPLGGSASAENPDRPGRYPQ